MMDEEPCLEYLEWWSKTLTARRISTDVPSNIDRARGGHQHADEATGTGVRVNDSCIVCNAPGMLVLCDDCLATVPLEAGGEASAPDRG